MISKSVQQWETSMMLLVVITIRYGTIYYINDSTFLIGPIFDSYECGGTYQY